MSWARVILVCGLGALGCAACPEEEVPSQQGESASPEATLVLLHTSDLHSQVWPFRARLSALDAKLGLGRAGSLEELGGFARLASVLESERQRSAALWLDSGDALEGAEVFQRLGGQLELELLGGLGLAALALGNHELSLAAEDLAELLARSAFPVLAADLTPSRRSPLLGRLGSTALLSSQGVKLGVVGLANPSSPPDLASPTNPWGLVVTLDLAATVQAAIDELSPHADLLVVLSHLGLEQDRELLRATSGVDLLLGGHQHIVTADAEWQDDCAAALLREQRSCGPRAVPIVHSGAYGKLVSRLELSLVRSPSARFGFEIAGIKLAQLPLTASVPEHPDVLERLRELELPPKPPLAFAPVALPRRSALGGDSALGNLTADALRAATGADVALLNSSALRADLQAGLVLEPDLELVLPFAEPWFLAPLSGASLRQGLLRGALRAAARECVSVVQVSGLKLRIDCAACRAESSECLELLRPQPWGDQPVLDDHVLLVSLPRYLLQEGADFEAPCGGRGRQVPLAAFEAVARHIARGASRAEGQDCVEALRRLSTSRCQSAFGAVACPIEQGRAAGLCHAWPRLLGGRDGRIQMLP
ncbi:MAG TPA: 5'-nucleotidase C-terminal domain-containing protein [Polyangiaceae bacterium]|nr:5'-nucleotidase C-terminal domain-containing protein [Polyangiaceae bacterium]